ncbi:MAG TPA: tRNA (guanosine(37)-N1)-methyltransferase TrmD [Candidatus Kapabacteria bacterium]|nr:tRNA (guanosine(37)-N1)-methyltransferase TrmD [Candidatus Kapabacteria bacterium]HOV91848.1 tRNA (guanosine(37)-N1)-methyltransferase TrmD [Candidatus Kapabacteria bacterium]
MRFDIISAVPDSIREFLNYSINSIAEKKEIVEYYFHNLHDFADNNYRRIDDYPFGGGPGMIIRCEPVFRCIEQLKFERHYDEIIYFTPDGELLNQSIINELSTKQNLILLAGHYKGLDQRIRDTLITREISIGDYVLSGGELPAAILIDAIVRLLPRVLGDSQSALDDSFQNGLLEAPVYTRPADFRGMKVPEVLLNGNHKEIEEWKIEQALKKTKKLRPDMLKD